jgi:hypothetical protein
MPCGLLPSRQKNIYWLAIAGSNENTRIREADRVKLLSRLQKSTDCQICQLVAPGFAAKEYLYKHGIARQAVFCCDRAVFTEDSSTLLYQSRLETGLFDLSTEDFIIYSFLLS